MVSLTLRYKICDSVGRPILQTALGADPNPTSSRVSMLHWTTILFSAVQVRSDFWISHERPGGVWVPSICIPHFFGNEGTRGRRGEAAIRLTFYWIGAKSQSYITKRVEVQWILQKTLHDMHAMVFYRFQSRASACWHSWDDKGARGGYPPLH